MFRKRWINWIVNLIWCCLVPGIYAQVIDPGQFIDQKFPVFDEAAIARDSIERISVKLLAKPSMRPIKDEGERIIYTFDPEGRMTNFSHVFPRLSGKLDTIRRVFFYQGDELVSQTEILGSYRRKVTHEPKSDHTRQMIEVKRGSRDWEVLDIEKIERQWSTTDSGKVLTELTGGLNSAPYQRLVTTFDDEGRLLKREVWNGPRLQSSEYWHYKSGHLVAYGFEHSDDPHPISITYAVKGERHDSGTWCAGGTCMNWSMVYYPNGLPKGWIFIEPETEHMKVWEFYYSHRSMRP